jgi:CheY-like chemotaxis protein
MKTSLLRSKAALEKAQFSDDDAVSVGGPLVRKQPSPSKVSPQSGMKLLLVEDDFFQAMALDSMCKKEGYQTALAKSGEEAIAMLTSDPTYDFVLCDVVMPGMDGHDVLLWVRKQFKPSEITVVMISSNDNEEMVERCLLHGAESYLLKPASAKEISCLWQFVARRQQQSERVARKENDLLECIQARPPTERFDLCTSALLCVALVCSALTVLTSM